MNSSLKVEAINVLQDGRRILSEISFSLQQGELAFILGNNGAGKSTLLKAIMGMVPYEGQIRLNERDIRLTSRRALATEIAYVPQGVELKVPYTVEEFISLSGYAGQRSSREMQLISQEVMQLAGCASLSTKAISTLSGGEKQRVLIAAAVAQKPRLLLVDEPTTFLDPKHQCEITALFDNLRKNYNVGILAVSHEISFMLNQDARYIALKEGTLQGHGPIRSLAEG